MASGVKKDRWSDKLKDNHKREHKKESVDTLPLNCYGESITNDSLSLIDRVPPFKIFVPFDTQKQQNNILTFPYIIRQQKLEKRRKIKAKRRYKAIASVLMAKKKKNKPSKAKENVIVKIDSFDEKPTKLTAKKQKDIKNITIEYKNTLSSPNTLKMPRKSARPAYGIRSWINENANDNIIIKNKNYSVSYKEYSLT